MWCSCVPSLSSPYPMKKKVSIKPMFKICQGLGFQNPGLMGIGFLNIGLVKINSNYEYWIFKYRIG